MQKLIEEIYFRNLNHPPRHLAPPKEIKRSEKEQAFFFVCNRLNSWLLSLNQHGFCLFENSLPVKQKTWRLAVGGKRIDLVINEATGPNITASLFVCCSEKLLGLAEQPKSIFLGHVKCWPDGAMSLSHPNPDNRDSWSAHSPFDSGCLESLLLKAIKTIFEGEEGSERID